MKTFTLYLFSVLLFLIAQPTASAAVITVTNTNNSGAGSLRQAITIAASGDEIVFSNAINGSAIILDSVLTIDKDLTITGNGMQNTIIDGGKNDRVLWIESGLTVSISGLIVQNGQVFANYNKGGGILSLGNLTMTNCWVRGNSVIFNMDPAFSYGGGISSSGDLVLINCIVSGNFCYTRGAGIYWSDGDITLINTTVAGNLSHLEAGGIHFSGGSFHDFILRNSIVWANEASQNSQVWGDFDEVNNSIVEGMNLTSSGSGNLDGTNPANDPNFIIGYKVNIPNTGGDYRIMANSNLIDAGNNVHNSTSSDIFGVGRTFDGDLNGTATIDIGAVEFNNYPGLFITQWDTRNQGTSADNQITIPTYGFASYNYTVHWGDGSSTTTSSSSPLTHTYAFAPQLPIYNVVIEGTFPRILFNDGGDKEKILAVLNWGDNPWVSMRNAFKGCSNLTIETPFSPNFNSMTDMSWMFQNATSMNENFENWEVSNITNMAGTFDGATSFNGDIGDWDVSSVNTFSVMFRDATAFNRDIGNWNTGSGVGMGSMFQGATSFNRDIGNWNVGNVEIFHRMFESGTAFNQDIGDWDVSKATSFAYMFRNATAFDQDLGNWDISSLTSGSGSLSGCKFMFEGAELSVANYDNLLIGWNRLDPGETSIPLGVEFHGGSSRYCAGEGAHMDLDNNRFWSFTDGGSLVTYDNISVETCSTYTVPSGNATYTVTGTYRDTIPNSSGCDSILIIDLTILNSAYSYSVEVCESYTVPSGDETYIQSGIYMDTIPNTAGCDSILTIDLSVDEIPPTAVCQDIVVHLDMNGQAFISAMGIDGGSIDNCGIDTLMLNQDSFDCSHTGVQNTILTVMDFKGNSSSCTANVTVIDTLPPLAICQDITLSLDANGNGIITANDIDAGSTDNCGIASMNLDTTTFDCSDIGDHSVTLTVVDENGNSSSCIATVTVVDDMPPTLMCQDVTVYLDESGTGPISPTATGAYVSRSDNCGLPSYIIYQVIDVNCSRIGDNYLYLEQPDLNGNSTRCYYTLTIADTISPMAVCQDITVSLDTNGQLTVDPIALDGGSTDNCSITSRALDKSSFDCSDIGTNTVVLTVTDQSGNSNTCTTTITIEDNIPPTAICQDVTISVDGNGSASLTPAEVDGGSFDNCSISSMSIDKTSFSCTDLGDQTVVLTVTDQSGNSANCNATVTVEDNIAPTVSCNGDVTLNTSSNGSGDCTAYVPFSDGYVLDDNCPDFIQAREIFINELGDTLRDMIFDLNAGGWSPVFNWPAGMNTATIIPIDASGNEGAACSYQVTVIDDEAPVANCQDITVQLNEQGVVDLNQYSIGDVNGRLPLQNSGDPNLTTDCDCPEDYVAVGYEGFAGCIVDEFRLICKELLPDGSLGNTTAVTCFSSSGSTVNETHELTGDQVLVGFEVSDVDYSFASTRILSEVKGIGKSISQIINIEDNSTQNTMLSSIAGSGCYSSNEQTSTEYALAGHVIVGMSVTSAGGYTPAVRFRYAPVSNTLAIDNGSTDNCGITNATLSPSGFDCDDVGGHTAVYTVRDRFGNSNSCNAVITVEDNVPPVVLCRDATIFLNENGTTGITSMEIDNGSTDSCGIDTISLDKTSFDCSETGQNTVVLTATDVNGNTASCTATVTVLDTVSPIASCRDITVELDANGEVEIMPSDIDDGSFDNCDIGSMDTDISEFDCQDVGPNTVILTVTDESGNTNSCTATVTVEDNVPPTPICQAITIELDENGETSIQASDIDGGSFDNCGIDTLVLDITSFDCDDVGPNTVTMTATDVNGNTAACQTIVTVEDNIPPTALCRDITIELDESGEAAIQPSEIDNGSFDNCEIDNLELDQTTFDCSHMGQNTVQLTVWDVNGNSQSCNATVTVEDNIAPVVLSVPADITLECDIHIPGDEPIAEDNCDVIITYEDAIIPGNCAGEYVVRRTFTITDPSGNEAAFKPVREIQFIDTKVPYLISAPSDQTLTCGTTPPLTLPVVEDNCDPAPAITWTDTYREDPSCPQGGRIDRIFTISDDCGNSYKLLQQFYFYDDLDPVITPLHPDLVNLPNGGTLQYQCYAQNPNWELIEFDMDDFEISDNCSGDIKENLMEIVIGNGDCLGDGYLARTKYTVSADDGCGNTSSFEFFIELVDEEAPELVGVPDDLTLSCDEEYNYPAISGCSEVGDVYTVDECECAEVTEVRDTIGSGCDLEYSVIVTYMATDNCGNTSTASYTITVEDNSAPEVYSTIPELEGLSNGSNLDINCNGAHFPAWAQSIGPETFQATDNCSQSNLIDFSENIEGYEDCFDHGALASLQYKWRFEDECGNEISHEIELRLVDTSAPEIVMVQAHVCASQEVVYPEVMDNCGEVKSLDYRDKQITDACSGETVIERTWTAIDHCGNIGTAVQTVIGSRILVYDFNVELLSGVENGDTIAIECSELDMHHPFENWISLERDCFEGGEVMSFEEKQGEIDSQCTQGMIRTDEWVWTVRTICYEIHEIRVFVQAEDRTGPVLIDFEEEIELTCGEEKPVYSAMDFCSTSNTVEEVSFDWVEGDSCENQHYERVIKATDICGNEATYTQSVIINTSKGPELSGVPVSVCDENELENVRAYDHCAEMEVPVSYTDVLTENCGEGRRTLRVYRAESLCGTISMDSVYIIRGDEEAPEYELVGEMLQGHQDGSIVEIQCDGNMRLRDLPLQASDIKFNDDCDPGLNISFSDRMENGNCDIDSYLERRILEWKAIDVCGNQIHFRIEFHMVDTEAPQFGFVQKEVVVSCGEQGNIDKVIAYDNCSGGVELIYEDGMPLSTERGTEMDRTWTAIDACGNTNSIMQTLIYEDTDIQCEILLPEIINCHEKTRISASVTGGTGPYSYNWSVREGYGEILQGQGTANIVMDVAYSNTELILVVQDQNGCISSCEAFFICFLKQDRDITRESDKLEYHLYQNSPNPFSDKTTIGFNLPEQTDVTIRIFNVEGKQVHQIKSAYEAGYNEVELRRDAMPTSGMYFYELSAGDFRGVKRMIILE